MTKRRFIFPFVLCVAAVGFSAEAAAEDDEGVWVPVPLEELERATLRRPEPQTPSSAPEVLPEDTGGAPLAPASAPAETAPSPPPVPPASRLTPEEIARRLRSKESSPIVPPRRGGMRRKRSNTILAEEGQAVIGRIGRVERIGQTEEYLITFENNRHLPYQPPQRLLPCRLLEEVEEYLRTHPDARFRVSGESTRDARRSYLLLQRVAIVDKDITDDVPAPAEASPSSPAGRAAGSENTTGSLIAEMLRDRPGRAVRTTPAPRRSAEENVESVAPAGQTPFSPGKQDLVVDRVIRVIRETEGEWWLARFESDNTLREPPLRILPGLRLEWIKMTMEESGKADMLLRVSGEVTYYRGRRYLMLRKVLHQRDMGEF